MARIGLRGLVLAVGLVAGLQAMAAGEVELPDVDLGTSPIFDLAETPLGMTVLQFVAIKYRDDALQSRLATDINALAPKIEAEIASKPMGYLLEVNVYTGDGDILQIPGGQLISLVGPGREPVDSLAEAMRVPSISNAAPPGASNRSFYVWLKQDGGTLKATVMTPEFSRGIEPVARGEAIRRDRMAAFEQADPGTMLRTVQRAEFWEKVYEQRSAAVTDEANRLTIQRLNREMKKQQDHLNKLYEEFQEAVAASQRSSSFVETMQMISTITSVVGAGIQAGSMIGNLGPVGSAGTPAFDGGTMLEYNSLEMTEQNGIKTMRATQIRVTLGNMQNTEFRLQQAWEQQGVVLPQSDKPQINLNLD